MHHHALRLLLCRANGPHSCSVSIYGGTLVFLYLASTFYHAIRHFAAKQVFHILDHVGIFLLIKLRDQHGWVFFGVIWGLALVRLPFNHAIWHLFVMGGSVCHFVLIWHYCCRRRSHFG